MHDDEAAENVAAGSRRMRAGGSPTPWRVEDYTGDAWWLSDLIVSSDGTRVAYTAHEGSEDDAALIVRAVNHLSACQPRLAEAMHDADWDGKGHLWTACAIEAHRSYYERIAATYSERVARLAGAQT